MTATTATAPVSLVKPLSKAEAQAALAAAKAAEKKVAATLAKAAMSKLPEHEFKTGSKGRRFQGNIDVDGESCMVLIQIVRRSTVTKAETPAGDDAA